MKAGFEQKGELSGLGKHVRKLEKDLAGVFGRAAASTPGYPLQSLRDNDSKGQSNLLDRVTILRSSTEF